MPKTAFEIGFNYNGSVYCPFRVDVGALTAARTAPYLIALSTDLSVELLISGEYSSSNFSSSWSDNRRASAYANDISRREYAVARGRTASFEENRNSREPLCFPMTTASVLLYQICATWLAVTTDSVR